jgi:hypothetical protein
VGIHRDYVRRTYWKKIRLWCLQRDVFKAIVSQAHAAGLRVSVHIVSAGDFKVAIESGADEIAHIPAFANVSPEIAKLAANRGVPVVPTMAQKTGDAIPPPMREAAAAMLVGATNNLKIMAANGVPIVIGADTPTDTPIAEAAFLKSLGMFDNAAMLRIWGRQRHWRFSQTVRLVHSRKNTKRAFSPLMPIRS